MVHTEHSSGKEASLQCHTHEEKCSDRQDGRMLQDSSLSKEQEELWLRDVDGGMSGQIVGELIAVFP